jgi:hypothetical protein
VRKLAGCPSKPFKTATKLPCPAGPLQLPARSTPILLAQYRCQEEVHMSCSRGGVCQHSAPTVKGFTDCILTFHSHFPARSSLHESLNLQGAMRALLKSTYPTSPLGLLSIQVSGELAGLARFDFPSITKAGPNCCPLRPKCFQILRLERQS